MPSYQSEKHKQDTERMRRLRQSGLSWKQIGEIYGLNYNTVRERVSRWERNRLRPRYRLQKGRRGESRVS